METKVSRESAETQIDLFFEYYDIELSDFPEEQRKALEGARRKIIRAIMHGRLEVSVDEVIEVTQHLKSGDVLKYAELSGKSKAEMGKAGDDNYAKIYGLVGSLTSAGSTGIQALKGKDLGLAESMGTLYLQV